MTGGEIIFRILFLERSKLVRKIIMDKLKHKEIEIIQVSTIEEALIKLKKIKIDFILTELELGEYTAKDFIDRLNNNENASKLPVVLITSNDSIELRNKYFKLGIMNYLIKSELQNDGFFDTIMDIFTVDKAIETSNIKNVKVAVVDDSLLVLKMIKNIFNSQGITNVDYFTTPREVLEAAKVKDYDVFIIDLVLKNKSGKEILIKLRENSPEKVLIIISGIENTKIISNTLKLGANDYIIKPFDKEIFLARIETNVNIYNLNRKLKEASIRDSMTGLYNHSTIIEYLEKNIDKEQISVIMFDIDKFKKINDTYGHQFGDRVIKLVGKIIEKNIKEYGSTGRYGGEEFLSVLIGISEERAIILIEQIRKEINVQILDRFSIKVTISAGLKYRKNEDYNEMIKIADDRLYKAKTTGRNKLIF